MFWIDLNYTYDQKLEVIIIRSKCNWYEDGQKSLKFFPNLDKYWAIQNLIRLRKICVKEVKNQSQPLKRLCCFSEKLLTKRIFESNEVIINLLLLN